MKVCELEVPPPSLEACVVHAATRLLPHYVPNMSSRLRNEPMVQKALQLTRLVMDVGAAEGRSPWVGAGEGTGTPLQNWQLPHGSTVTVVSRVDAMKLLLACTSVD